MKTLHKRIKKRWSRYQRENEIALNKTIMFGNNAFGSTRKIASSDTLTKKEFRKAIKLLEKGVSGECWKTTYFPDWAKKYPMWLNKILFWLFNNIRCLWRFERYL
jgi:hypothetical protein